MAADGDALAADGAHLLQLAEGGGSADPAPALAPAAAPAGAAQYEAVSEPADSDDEEEAAAARTMAKELSALCKTIDPDACGPLLVALLDRAGGSHLSCAMVHNVEVGDPPVVVRSAPTEDNAMSALLGELASLQSDLAADGSLGTTRARAALRALIDGAGLAGAAPAPSSGTALDAAALGTALGTALKPVLASAKAASGVVAGATEKMSWERINARGTGLRAKLRAKYEDGPEGYELANATLLHAIEEEVVTMARFPTAAKVSIDRMAPLEDGIGQLLGSGEHGAHFDLASGTIRPGLKDAEAKDAKSTSEYLAKLSMLLHSMALVCVDVAASRDVASKYFCSKGEASWCSLGSVRRFLRAAEGCREYPLALVKDVVSDALHEARTAVNDDTVVAAPRVSPSASLRGASLSLTKVIKGLGYGAHTGPVGGPLARAPEASALPPTAPAAEAAGTVTFESMRAMMREEARAARASDLELLGGRGARGGKTNEERQAKNKARREKTVKASDGNEYKAMRGGNRANPDPCPGNLGCLKDSWCPFHHNNY